MPIIKYSEILKVPSIIPTDDDGEIPVEIDIMYHGKRCNFCISVPMSIYNGAKSADKTLYCPPYNDNEWEAWYYPVFVTDENQSPILQNLLDGFRRFKKTHNLDRLEYCELLTLYVQSLKYDTDKLNRLESLRQIGGTDGQEPVRFAIETVVDKTGICCESSILLAALLNLEGYAVSLLSFDDENHMVVGVPSSIIFDYHCSGYAVIETVSIKYIGDANTTLSGINRSLWTRPEILVINNESERRYELNPLLSQTYTILRAERILKNKTEAGSPFNTAIMVKTEAIEKLKPVVNDLSLKRESLEKELRMLPSKSRLYTSKYMDYTEYNRKYTNESKKLNALVDDLTSLSQKMEDVKRLLSVIQTNIHNRDLVYTEVNKMRELWS